MSKIECTHPNEKLKITYNKPVTVSCSVTPEGKTTSLEEVDEDDITLLYIECIKCDWGEWDEEEAREFMKKRGIKD